MDESRGFAGQPNHSGNYRNYDMATKPLKYKSFNTLALFYPLLHLVEKLEGMELKGTNDVQSGIFENGYSCAIIVLAVTIFESAVTFLRVLRKQSVRKTPAADYFRTLINKRTICSSVDEMVAVRDSIVHSHVYSADVAWDASGALKAVRPYRRLPQFGNKRLKRVRTKNQVTKILKLNLVPTRINRRDVYFVLRTLDDALTELESVPPGYVIIRDYPFPSVGWMKTFHELIEALPPSP